MSVTGAAARDVAAAAPGRLVARPVEALAGLDAEAWDALVPAGNVALTSAYLAAWEKAELVGLRACPLVASRPGSGRPVAGCPGYWYQLDLAATRLPAVRPGLAVARRWWPGLLMARTYELGSPAPLTDPFLVGDGPGRRAAVRALAEAGLEEGRRGGAQFLLVQNLTSLDCAEADELVGLGFTGVPILPTAVVDLRPYGSFEEYLGAMRSSYRRRAHQALARSCQLHFERRERFGALAGELARLWHLIYDRARELRREVLTPAYFEAMSELSASSVLLALRPDGSVASFALLLAEPPNLAFLHCGFEAGAGQAEGAYFRLLYEIVRVGIDGGFEQIDLGLTTIEPKLDVGAVPVPLFAFLKHRNPVLQRLVAALATGPARPPEHKPRRVFKEPPPTAGELVARRGLPG